MDFFISLGYVWHGFLRIDRHSFCLIAELRKITVSNYGLYCGSTSPSNTVIALTPRGNFLTLPIFRT